jgi:hypothetical protein
MGADVGDGVAGLGEARGEGSGEADEVRVVVEGEIDDIGGGDIGAEEMGAPTGEFKEVGYDAEACVVEFAGNAGGDEGARFGSAGEGALVEAGHDELCGGGGVMLLGGGDALDLPEAADLALCALEDFEVDVFEGGTGGEGFGNGVGGLGPVRGKERSEIGLGEGGQGMGRIEMGRSGEAGTNGFEGGADDWLGEGAEPRGDEFGEKIGDKFEGLDEKKIGNAACGKNALAPDGVFAESAGWEAARDWCRCSNRKRESATNSRRPAGARGSCSSGWASYRRAVRAPARDAVCASSCTRSKSAGSMVGIGGSSMEQNRIMSEHLLLDK